MQPGRPRLRHPGRLAAVAAVGLLASYVVARRRPVPGWELHLTEVINRAPDAVATGLYPIMQLGTVWAPLVVAAAIYGLRRDGRLAAAAVLAGLGAWFGAKAVKSVVRRGRPLAYLPQIDVRDGTGVGLGYVSGHSAVAASAAVVAAAALPPRWRPALAVVADTVGVARIVYGVHLPADVVGGWSFGTLVALAAMWLVDTVAARAGSSRVEPA